ncbi:flagellar biosynthetic protein FliO [Variovorax ginsengisoli]|uniref:Flagellar biosynthetic protein FliO n=1 Tax=Variovorax ginsengisoli TaxID=363844 RepID=A0ABT8SE36_9BURK|nr:flagellar biosynthetic protein FliO [Variovorax ginsengisoli]MDN8618022.1 flagellar biosynthetic protein FliO [Variovorax ginsengisoli]MDO1537192.1 flagellar biosynthetic protein FliO [Variovorax ginsengisoli]
MVVNSARVGMQVACLATALFLGGIAPHPAMAELQTDAQTAQARPRVSGLPASIPVQREATDPDSMSAGSAAWITLGVVAAFLTVALSLARARMRTPNQRGTQGLQHGRFRRLLGGKPSAGIDHMATTRLSPSHSLHVVEWEGRRILLGCSTQSIQLLAEVPARDADSKVAP